MHTFKMIAIASAMLAMQSAQAAPDINTVYTEFGTGSKVRMVRAGVTSDWNDRWFQSNGTSVRAYWDVSAGAWRGTQARNIPGAHQNLMDVGLTPVFRFQRDDGQGFYAEAGIGAHLLSKKYDNNDDKLSTDFQFGDHVGVGYVFNRNWEVTAKYQHFSNGGIKKPNSGVDFGVVRLTYRF
ncbi:acyloxyacyl hydrolase [Pseudoduganella ginsengisoli]|uniref:Lipid A deacylase n=1 Tax=Pseudoduganella ginsengisoli TaxID=1462440 RepID=A0A6L6PXE6_9BURK|nr:acyloxyacyl hydrolase [Pseudoduganella ginsengisoli]MTW01382.1 outer membrane beta-barrel protein [Pseudoduganella ginsengisoli]